MTTKLFASLVALGLGMQTAHAQTVSIATTNPGGLVHQIGTALSDAVTRKTDLRLLPVPAGGSPNPAVASGDSECGINIGYDVSYYVNASGYYTGNDKHASLRAVGAMLPSLTGMYVATDSDIRTIADLEGKRVPGGLNAQLSIAAIYDAVLNVSGVTRDDVETVMVPNIAQGADDFAAGRADAFMYSIGTAKVLEVDSSVGGIRTLSIDGSEETRDKLAEALPGARLTTLQPNEGVAQVLEPTNVVTVDLILFCNENVPEETVYEITKTIHESKAEMVEIYKGMSRFEPDNMPVDVPGITYHPGAQKFYEEAGLSPPKG